MGRVTGKANEYYGGGLKQVMEVVIPLGTSSVTTQTKLVGMTRRAIRITGIKAVGQAAVTATTLTGEVFARTTAGATGVTMQASTMDLDFASAAAAKTGVSATLTATEANMELDEGQALEIVITASSATAGPGDLLVQVEYEPRFK